jgi:hypothetical protein
MRKRYSASKPAVMLVRREVPFVGNVAQFVFGVNFSDTLVYLTIGLSAIV